MRLFQYFTSHADKHKVSPQKLMGWAQDGKLDKIAEALENGSAWPRGDEGAVGPFYDNMFQSLVRHNGEAGLRFFATHGGQRDSDHVNKFQQNEIDVIFQTCDLTTIKAALLLGYEYNPEEFDPGSSLLHKDALFIALDNDPQGFELTSGFFEKTFGDTDISKASNRNKLIVAALEDPDTAAELDLMLENYVRNLRKPASLPAHFENRPNLPRVA